VKNVKRCRATALLCRQQAVLHPEASWHWLAEAERYEDLAEAEIEAHFKECNGGVELRRQIQGALAPPAATIRSGVRRRISGAAITPCAPPPPA
jgi:hypothetical protein